MKLDEYFQLWEDYFKYVIQTGEVVPQHVLLNKYYSSYVSSRIETERIDVAFPEPYLGNPRTAKIAIVNKNPGGVLDFQKWKSGLVCQEMKQALDRGLERPYYDIWASQFWYLTAKSGDPKLTKGANSQATKWWVNRKKFAAAATGLNVETKDIVAYELYAWHSKQYGKLQNSDIFFKEFILDPIFDSNVKYVFLLRKDNIIAAKNAGIKLETVQHKWETKGLKVEMYSENGRVFIGTQNNVSGYTTNSRDLKVIQELLKQYEIKSTSQIT